MKVAAIYDIHGNLPALEAVLAEIDQAAPDLILVGGDVASGPMPRATLDRLMGLGERACFIRGNADRELINQFDGVLHVQDTSETFQAMTGWAAQQLDQRHRDFLASFAERAILTIDGLGDVLFCHGSPRSDEEVLTVATSDQRLQAALTEVEQAVVVCGHTHMQFDRQFGKVRIVNAGSVGMPYGDPGAYWLWLGPQVMLRQTRYDFEFAARLIRATEYPQAQEFADHNVLQPPTAAEAIEVFERMAAS
ncbi:MAG TPA: metallophosphoesterase family protein [Ktedonobacterales bacterium]|jgi:putative phosphoesterase